MLVNFDKFSGAFIALIYNPSHLGVLISSPVHKHTHTYTVSQYTHTHIDRSTCQAHGNYPLRVSVALAQARALLHRRAAARLAHPPCCALRALRGSARTSSALRALRALRGSHILRADCAGCTRCAARTSSALRALHALGALGATYCTLRATRGARRAKTGQNRAKQCKTVILVLKRPLQLSKFKFFNSKFEFQASSCITDLKYYIHEASAGYG